MFCHHQNLCTPPCVKRDNDTWKIINPMQITMKVLQHFTVVRNVCDIQDTTETAYETLIGYPETI
jgi:hypothetical protein